MRLARTETFDHTISGLLTKRAELFNEAALIRERLSEITNDIEALDRVLHTFGHDGPLDSIMPRRKRQVIFGKGELTTIILRHLREAAVPLTGREITDAVMVKIGRDATDKALRREIGNRVAKTLRVQRENHILRSSRNASGILAYEIVTAASTHKATG